MKVLLIGGTGFIGRAVLERLLAKGHSVTALTRNAVAAAEVSAVGAQPFLVEKGMQDTEKLRGAVSQHDAVIDCASHFFSGATAALASIREALAPDKMLIGTTGTNFFGDQETPVSEAASCGLCVNMPDRWPDKLKNNFEMQRKGMISLEASVLEGTAKGLRTCIIRPSWVYGRGSGGLGDGIVGFMRSAKDVGHATFVDDGRRGIRPTVHVDDLGDLYILVLEALASGALAPGSVVSGSNGSISHQVFADGISAASGGLPVERLSLQEAEAKLGFQVAENWTRTCHIDWSRARSLGWTPSQPSLAEELATGSYAWPKLAEKIQKKENIQSRL